MISFNVLLRFLITELHIHLIRFIYISFLKIDSHHREETMKRIKELQDFIAGQETDITEFDEALVKKLIEKITVFADHFTVEFKSGITIDIEA